MCTHSRIPDFRTARLAVRRRRPRTTYTPFLRSWGSRRSFRSHTTRDLPQRTHRRRASAGGPAQAIGQGSSSTEPSDQPSGLPSTVLAETDTRRIHAVAPDPAALPPISANTPPPHTRAQQRGLPKACTAAPPLHMHTHTTHTHTQQRTYPPGESAHGADTSAAVLADLAVETPWAWACLHLCICLGRAMPPPPPRLGPIGPPSVAVTGLDHEGLEFG